MRSLHDEFCRSGLQGLSRAFKSLDASQPWIVYWIVHALHVMGSPLSAEEELGVVKRVLSFENAAQGCFGGGHLQYTHLAASYAATGALMEAFNAQALQELGPYGGVDREAVLQGLLALKNEDGSFRMHQGGEIDVRGTYCALSVAHAFDVLTPELCEGCADFVARCQSFDGGFAAVPGSEAHGGYSFCALAALRLLGRMDVVDIDAVLHWATHRQMAFEGGFQGRTHKLVDSCYSLWMGGIFALLQPFLDQDALHELASDPDLCGSLLCDQFALQKYVLVCCQVHSGGLRDKPGMTPDFYHTCYALSGCSIMQNADITLCVFGKSTNLLSETHPILNVTVDKYCRWMELHGRKPDSYESKPLPNPSCVEEMAVTPQE